MIEMDKAAFNGRFLTSDSLAAELGQHFNTAAAIIWTAGIRPLAPDRRDFGAMYLRTELGRILGPERANPIEA